MPIGTLFGNMLRTQEVMMAFVHHGFGDLLDMMGLSQYVGRSLEPIDGGAEPYRRMSGARRFREALEEAGGAFVKLGQLLSTRPDLLPRDWIEELSQLQDAVAAVEFPRILATLEEDIGPAGEHFSRLDPEPLAAGSIAQVHGGTTREGADVVVKVQRPGIGKVILQDCDILHGIAELLEAHVPDARNYRPVEVVREFRAAIEQELDFALEGQHLDRFRSDFSGIPRVVFPKPIWEHSSERVLTMQRVTGIKISRIDDLRDAGVDTTVIAKTLAEAILRQILEYGFLHGDPHPGNILVLDQEQVCFLDCGMVAHLDERMRENLVLLVAAGIRKDAESVTDILIQMNALPESDSRDQFIRETDMLLERYHRLPLKRIRFSSIVVEMNNLVRKYEIRIPSDLLIVGKALITLEGVGRTLDPDFDAMSTAEPFVREMVITTYGPRYLGRKILQGTRDMLRLMRDLPADLRELSRILRSNQFRMVVEHAGLKDSSGEVAKALRQLAAAVVVGALLLGSALVMHSPAEPRVLGAPVLGLGGFVLAMVLVVWIILATRSNGQ